MSPWLRLVGPDYQTPLVKDRGDAGRTATLEGAAVQRDSPEGTARALSFIAPSMLSRLVWGHREQHKTPTTSCIGWVSDAKVEGTRHLRWRTDGEVGACHRPHAGRGHCHVQTREFQRDRIADERLVPARDENGERVRIP